MKDFVQKQADAADAADASLSSADWRLEEAAKVPISAAEYAVPQIEAHSLQAIGHALTAISITMNRIADSLRVIVAVQIDPLMKIELRDESEGPE
jgi:hypothetical protein